MCQATPEELAAREADMLQQEASGGSIEALEGQDGVQQFNEAPKMGRGASFFIVFARFTSFPS